MDQYDFVWYAPQHSTQALALLKRLPDDEKTLRRLQWGLVTWDNVPIPTATGDLTKEAGSCTVRDFFGVQWFQPGQVTDRQKSVLAEKLMIKELIVGELVVGNIRNEIIENPPEAFVERSIKHRKTVEESLAVFDKEHELKALQTQQQAADARLRYLVTTGHFAGINKPSLISEQELSDIFHAAVFMGKEMPPVDKWMAYFAPLTLEQEMPLVPRSDDEYHGYIAAARSSVVKRVERTRES